VSVFPPSGRVNNSPGESFSAEGFANGDFSPINGLSGYKGPIGLTGVFLGEGVSPASPGILQNFNQGTSFSSLSPQLGQVFFVGDGLTGNGTGNPQSFIAPSGATRLYFGIPDGAFFRGVPGNYEDNGGSFGFFAQVTPAQPPQIGGGNPPVPPGGPPVSPPPGTPNPPGGGGNPPPNISIPPGNPGGPPVSPPPGTPNPPGGGGNPPPNISIPPGNPGGPPVSPPPQPPNPNASALGNGVIPDVYLRVVQTVGANIRQAETPGNRFFDVPNGNLGTFYNLPAGGVLANFPNGTRALDGNDTVIGSAANDVIYGNQGDDSLRGEAGDDNLLGGRDNDILEGGAGTDYINGNIGNDFVSGGDGNDYVRGGQGNDILSGGEGADILIGDFGTDTLTGGIGPDAFIIRSSVEPNPTRDLADVISDFSSLDDVILITGSFTIRDLAIEASGSDTTIRTLSGNFLARVLNNTPGRVQESLVVIPENSPILTL